MKQVAGQTDIFSHIDEAENGPPPCSHASANGFSFDVDPKSPYYLEWVHGDLKCRRSKFPGRKYPECLKYPSRPTP